MAQFYQVLSQDDKSNEASHFYPNVEENQGVQYVITPEGTPQQFQPQQVVVASDQLMVVDGQSQPVILDQSQVAYQTSSYIIQDSSGIDFQTERQQQVYYMANAQPTQQVVVEQPITQPQPVVLNHQLMQNQISRIETGSPIHQVTSTNQISLPLVQEKAHEMPTQKPIHNMPAQLTRPPAKAQVARHLPQTALKGQQLALPQKPPVQEGTVQNFPRSNMNERQVAKKESEELLALPDGTLVNFPQYKRLLALQRENQGIHERLAAHSCVTSTTPRRPRNPNPRPRKRPAQPRGGRVNTFSSPEDEQMGEQLQQNAQFQNQLRQQPQLQQQQQVNRPQIPLIHPPPAQNQYIIQPPGSQASKPPVQRPLPAFLHSSQIQHIIESTPVNEEYSDSIRMLVLLDNGEQRLITFTLPKEACTIQEILEQVNVPFQHDTKIQVTEANANGLNYVVTVGDVQGFSLEPQNEEPLPSQHGLPISQSQPENNFTQPVAEIETGDLAKPASPEAPKELPARLVPGKLAVCTNCGYLSEDFNKCTRCKRKLPDNVKAISAISTSGKKIDPRLLVDKKLALAKSNGTPKLNLLQKKRPARPAKLLECETVVVSSDEEEDDKKSVTKNVNEQLLEKLGASVTISPISKEPSIIDIQKNSILSLTRSPEKLTSDQIRSTLLTCRTVRIGSYRFIPPEAILVDSTGLLLKVPHPKNDNTIKVIKIDSTDIVKVLISFQKSLPVLFYYLLPAVGNVIRAALDMVQGSDCYYDPLSESVEAHRRITLLPEVLTEDSKVTLQKIYVRTPVSILEELTYKEANEILVKTCPKDLTRQVMSYGTMTEVKNLLMYPPEGRGRIAISTDDYMCLAQDQFLNDVIIDFYLQYLLLNLPKEQQDKVYHFSPFFYKRLTTKPTKASRKSQPSELDPNLTPAQKRHARVKAWTKRVNLFEKDFIIVPINENCHWFLAIICFPNMNGTHTMSGQPIKIEPKQPKKKKNVTTIGNVTITSVKEKIEPTITCEEELSDKDEAEGDDSELDSDDSEESPPLSVENDKRPPIKQPCILIFDSLAGASRSRVVATLRDYLTCEYKAKMHVDKVFTKDVIKGACVKVPQQTNFTDCGLYLLQYVEQFFTDPIKDYHIPITHLKTWFDEITVTKKREDISVLIKSLMKQYGKDLSLVPDVPFPTINGEIVERPLEKDDNFVDPDEEDEEEEEMVDEDDEEFLPPAPRTRKIEIQIETNQEECESEEKDADSPTKPSDESAKTKNDFMEQTIINTTLLKPDISELPKSSNKDTLSYLKAKRIVRHKQHNCGNSSEGPDAKKVKSNETETTSS